MYGSALPFKIENEHEQGKKNSQNLNLEKCHAQINDLVDTMTSGLTSDCSASCGAKHKCWPPQLSFAVNVSFS